MTLHLCYQDIKNHPSRAFSPEDNSVVLCSPQTVSKVRPLTRCSSTRRSCSELEVGANDVRCVSWGNARRTRNDTNGPHIVAFLDGAEEWDKLESRIGEARILWSPGRGKIIQEGLPRVALSLFHRSPCQSGNPVVDRTMG